MHRRVCRFNEQPEFFWLVGLKGLRAGSQRKKGVRSFKRGCFERFCSVKPPKLQNHQFLSVGFTVEMLDGKTVGILSV